MAASPAAICTVTIAGPANPSMGAKGPSATVTRATVRTPRTPTKTTNRGFSVRWRPHIALSNNSPTGDNPRRLHCRRR